MILSLLFQDLQEQKWSKLELLSLTVKLKELKLLERPLKRPRKN
jgi:hypothetical protein